MVMLKTTASDGDWTAQEIQRNRLRGGITGVYMFFTDSKAFFIIFDPHWSVGQAGEKNCNLSRPQEPIEGSQFL